MPFQHGGHITKDLFGNLASVVAGRVRWLMLDRFLTDRAVGAVNNTAAEPGPGTRQTTEISGATVAISGGRAVLTGSGASYTDCILKYDTTGVDLTKARGKTVMVDWTTTVGDGRANFYANPASAPNSVWFRPRSSVFASLGSGLNSQQVWAALTNGQRYEIALIMRNPGVFVMLDGQLLFADSTFAGNYDFSNLFQIYDGTDLDDLRVVQLPTTNPALYPTPKLSDTFDTPVIIDYGDLGQDATPVNVTLDGVSGKYNNASSYVNILSAAQTLFSNPAESTVIAQAQILNAADWTPAAWRRVILFQADVNNTLYICQNVTTPGNITTAYLAGGVAKYGGMATGSPLTKFTIGVTVSAGADEFKSFFNGVKYGSTQTGLGTWAGAMTSARVGADGSGNTWPGKIYDVVLGDSAISEANVISIQNKMAAGTLTKADLDSIFGASHYLWYKQNETYTSNGLAHVEAGGVNGAGLTWGQAGLAWNNAQKTYIQPTPGADIAVDGNMEAAGVGAFTPSKAVLTKEVAAPHSGTQSLRVTMDGTATYGRGNQFYLTAGEIYRMTGWYHGDGVNNYPLIAHGAGTSLATGGTSTAWASYTSAFRALGNQLSFQANSVTSSGYSEFDDTFIYPITFADCLRYIDPSAGELLIRAKLTVTDLNMAGFVINLDSGTSPQNCIHVFVDRRTSVHKVVARNMVSGVWSADSLFVTITYSAGTYLEVRRIGTLCYVWYNNTYVGNWTTAVPSTNTKIALFATDSASYFTDITVFPTTGYNYGAYA